MAEICVKDLMLLIEEYATVDSEATIREALVSLSKAQMGLTNDRHHHRALLVLNRNRQIVGKLSHWAILRSLEPRLVHEEELTALAHQGLDQSILDTLASSPFLFQGSLERLCQAAARIKVKDAMIPVGESIDENTPLTTAIHQFVMRHSQSMPVTRDGRVIGLLRLSDVFEEVADRIRGTTKSNK